MAFSTKLRETFQSDIQEMRDAGLFKEERYIHSPQAADVGVEFPEGAPVKEVINLCANNYLGLSSHPEVIAAAHEGLESRGFGLSSVRFICGTQDIHRELEGKISKFLETEDTILFPSCFDANAGVFEAAFGPEDVLIADRLIHASLVDGIRLSKAQQDTYKHSDMKHLEKKLVLHADKRSRVIVTDGVFSMDGDVAKLDQICDLADKYDAMVVVDDCHSTGFMGQRGKGTHEHCNVLGRVDIITTTLGKAMGGATGGCVSGRREIVEMCRQKARPYLFSNSVAPVIVAASNRVMDLVSESTERRDKLEKNTIYWRQKLTDIGFDLKDGDTAIVPIMLYNAKLAQDIAREVFEDGIYVVGFYFPVVPKGQARIRTQVSAGHEIEHLDKAAAALERVGRKYDILGKKKTEIVEMYGL